MTLGNLRQEASPLKNSFVLPNENEEVEKSRNKSENVSTDILALIIRPTPSNKS